VKTALVLGGAACIHTDIEGALMLFTPDLIIAINDIGMIYKNVDHWVTKHPAKFPGWIKGREVNKLPPVPTLWTSDHRKIPGGYVIHRTESNDGGSGLLAVRVAVHKLGCTKVVLAGVPLQRQDAHYFSVGIPWKEAGIYRRGWVQAKKLHPFIKSMSGWTKEILGAPTVEWLASE